MSSRITSFIARRIAPTLLSSQQKSISTGSRVATFSIALSVAVVTIAMAISSGFRDSISQKVTLMAGDITLQNRDLYTGAFLPIPQDSAILNELAQLPNINYAYAETARSAVVGDSTNIYGLTLRGVDSNFPEPLMAQYVTEGAFPKFDSLERTALVLPAKIAQHLKLKVGDKFDLVYFGLFPLKIPFTLRATYSTGMDEIDKATAFANLQYINELAGISPNEADYLRIVVDPSANLSQVQASIDEEFGGYGIVQQTAFDQYPQIFDWLSMLDNNVSLLLIIMLIVAGVNMISAVLIVILENTQTIGLLKSLGMRGREIRAIFLRTSLIICFRGFMFGLPISLILLWVQSYFGVITLDPASYMVAAVPVAFDVAAIIVVNLLLLLGIVIFTIVPTFIINKLSPSEALKFS